MEAIKKSINTNTKKLRGKPSSIEGKTMGQIRSIHYNKIEITTLKLHPKLEFTMNWEHTIIPLETNKTSPQKSVARSFTLNTSILCDCSSQIIVLEKNPNLSSLCVLSKRKITFSFFPQCRTKHYFFSFSQLQNCVSLFTLSLSLSHETHIYKLYIKAFTT